MPTVWVVDADNPEGHAVEMTTDEAAAFDTYMAAATTAATAEQTANTNADSVRTKILNAIDTLENAWTNWGTLTAAQKDSALKLTVRVVVGLSRLVLRKLDTPGV